jgi:hypothetical protein
MSMMQPNMRHRLGPVTRAVFWSCVAVALGFGCGSSKEQRIANDKGGSCAINSDCIDPFVCAFARCHVECTKDRDCDDDRRCVKSDTDPGAFVCQLEDELACESDRDCPGTQQVCGIDDECRDPCSKDSDCLDGSQICSNSNECASTDPEHDHLDEEGNIKLDGAGSGGTSGQGGAGNEGGKSPGPVDGGASPGSGGAGGSAAPTGDAGAAGMSDGGEPGAGGAGAVMEDLTETPDGNETVPNDTAEQAVPLTNSATIHLSPADHDWFIVTPPKDGRSHIVSLVIEPDPTLRTVITARAVEDYSQIGDTSLLSQGVTSYAYLTIGPNAAAHLDFVAFTNSSGSAHITMTMVAENDAYEPNDDRNSPADIALDDLISAQLLRPYVSQIDIPSEDWFALELTQGEATLEVVTAPEVARMLISLTNPSNATSSLRVTSPAETPTVEFNVPTTGTYRLTFAPFTNTVESFSTGAKPDNLTSLYSFRVTQP